MAAVLRFNHHLPEQFCRILLIVELFLMKANNNQNFLDPMNILNRVISHDIHLLARFQSPSSCEYQGKVRTTRPRLRDSIIDKVTGQLNGSYSPVTQ